MLLRCITLPYVYLVLLCNETELIKKIYIYIPPRFSVLHPMTRKPIELSHLNSLIAPRGTRSEEDSRGAMSEDTQVWKSFSSKNLTHV